MGAFGFVPKYSGADDLCVKVHLALCTYVSEAFARAIVARATRLHGLDPRLLGPNELARLIPELERAAESFLDKQTRWLLRADLDALVDACAAPLTSETVEVRDELDISTARMRARAVASALGSNIGNVTRVATLVSELARNIVNYTPGGVITLIPSRPPPRVVIRASDRGTGIPQIEEVLAGRYRSKTGLGRGLSGSKRLADRFEIETGASGTRIEAEVRL